MAVLTSCTRDHMNLKALNIFLPDPLWKVWQLLSWHLTGGGEYRLFPLTWKYLAKHSRCPQIFASSAPSILGQTSTLCIEKLITETNWGPCPHHFVLFRVEMALFHSPLPTVTVLGGPSPSCELSILGGTRRRNWSLVEGGGGRAQGQGDTCQSLLAPAEQTAALSLVKGDFSLDFHLALKWKQKSIL